MDRWPYPAFRRDTRGTAFPPDAPQSLLFGASRLRQRLRLFPSVFSPDRNRKKRGIGADSSEHRGWS